MERVHIFISGNVQGVGMRYFLRNKALRLWVNGFVKNLKDGRVEAVFEGENNNVDMMIDFCRRGTFVSKVTNINIKREQYKKEFKEFEIRL